MLATLRQHVGDVEFATQGEIALIDLTQRVEAVVRDSGVRTGQCLVFTTSSTSAVTTIEHEPGLLKDLPQALERLFPKDLAYHHQETWHDGNGHSHVRASFLQPDLLLPIRGGKLHVGQWQQVVFVELDNKPRKRVVAVHVWGEA